MAAWRSGSGSVTFGVGGCDESIGGGRTRFENLQDREAAAGLAEAFRGGRAAEAENVQALFADAGGQAGEVGVAADEAEAVHVAGVQQVHGVDHQRDIGGVLARCPHAGDSELLLRDQRVARQCLVPAGQPAIGEIAIDAAHDRLATLGDGGEQLIGDARRDVLGVNQHSEAGARGWRHGAVQI